MRNISLFVCLIVGLALFSTTAFAAIVGPDTVTIGSSGRNTEGTDGAVLNAAAGNVTSVTISDTRITEHWAGFYGNVTMTITLDDANNNTLFDWTQATPKGEVFASNSSTVTWAHIKCVNFSTNGTGEFGLNNALNTTKLERFFQINLTEKDGFDETFNDTYVNGTGFKVGSVSIDVSQRCPMTYTYVNEGDQNASFGEVLLHDNVSIVFTALLEDTTDGFRNGGDPHDFQMIVAENGIAGFEATTPYYFFVELE